MSDSCHCPFLNRSDARCSDHLSLESLNHTYDFCFGKYMACSVYLELAVERRVRRLKDSALWSPEPRNAAMHGMVQLTTTGRPVALA